MIAAAIEARVRAGGLLAGPAVVLFSGGRDSTCLLDLAVRLGGPVTALHVNYGLRAEADADERHCAAVCERLGVALEVRRPGRREGNVQAWARAERYAEAFRLAEVRGAVVAAGHTATDQVETVLYRLAASPGRRALLGMPARAGSLVRPLLDFRRADTAAYCCERRLTWREDASNPASLRGGLRERLVPALRELHPAAEENVLRTLAVLRDEAAVLDAAVDAALAERPPRIAHLAALPPALARLAIQRLADEAAREDPPAWAAGEAASPATGEAAPWGAGEAPGPAVGEHVQAILALGAKGVTAALDLPGGLRAVATYGRLTIERRRAESPAAPATLPVPGATAYGNGEVTCERGPDLPIQDGTLDAAQLAPTLEIRPWRPGDRMRPLGLDGSKALQDLFTDRKIPRARRAQLPVVVSAGEIAWVPGLATGERFRVTPQTADRVRLAWKERA